MSKEIISKELLSLVIDDKAIRYIEKVENNGLIYVIDYDHLQIPLNLDTIGRLCKEYCLKQEYVINIYHHHDTVAVSMSNDGGLSRYSTPAMTIYTELEAIIKATEWVAKEKGLLCAN